MGRIVTCGICGYEFEEGNAEDELKHVTGHWEHGARSLILPNCLRDMVRYWADQVLREVSEDMSVSKLQEADRAKWVLMHMWYNGEGSDRPARDVVFKQYEAEIKKRYPNIRGLPTTYIGAP